MSFGHMLDQNYTKLGQIYNIFKADFNNISGINTTGLKKIINSGFDINYKLPCNSFITQKKPEYSGHTAIHLLVEFFTKPKEPYFDLLIQWGADFTCKNDNGCTPLLLAFKKGFTVKQAHLDKNNSTNFYCKNGISHFHVACSTNQIQIVDFFLKAGIPVNELVNNDSPVFPGYTPLHFAMDNLQLETVEILLSHGASLVNKNADGLTPLDLVIHKFSKIDSADNNYVIIKKFIEDAMIKSKINLFALSENSDSSKCLGFTRLHLVLLLNYNLDDVILCLEEGDNLLAKAVNGTTPFDLCLEKFNLDDIIHILLTEKQHQMAQLQFTNGMRLLKFLQAMNNQSQLKKCLSCNDKNENTFIPFDSPILAGYNFLHLTVIFDGFVNCILSCNVDFRMLNANGISPLHLAFRLKKVDTVAKILNFHEKIPLNCIDRDNLSSLHIACVMRNHKLVKLLLRNGSDPNLPTLCDFEWNFDVQYINNLDKIKKGSTPLHIAVSMIECELAIELLRFGANSYVPNVDGVTPYKIIMNHIIMIHVWKLIHMQLASVHDKMLENNIKALKVTDACLKTFYDALLCNNESWKKELQKVIQELYLKKRYKKLGLTKLQLACAIGDYSIIKRELKLGINVNEQINIESPLWPGNTALHILILKNQWTDKIAEMLFKYGANPNIKNKNNETPFHLIKDKNLEKAISLLSDKFASINPLNDEGLSHFHLCCKEKNFPLIKKFTKLGININASIDYFADNNAGCTPLHFALESFSIKIIGFLLANGADPNIKDGDGYTPLHIAASHEIFGNILRVLLRHPAVDVQITNIYGETAFERFFMKRFFLDEKKFEDIISIFLKKGATLKFARISTRSIATAASILSKETFQLLIAAIPDITDTDHNGQTVIHHLATLLISNSDCLKKYIYNIDILIQRGCEINHKDVKGRTALHLCINPGNLLGIMALLQNGADVHIKDDAGLKAYSYTSILPVVILTHLKCLDKIGFYVEESDKLIYSGERSGVSHKPFLDNIEEEKKRFQLMLEEKLSSPFPVNYFFTKKFIVDYRRLPVLQRRLICDVCKSVNLSETFNYLFHFVILQFRKARARTRLLEPASVVFHELIDMTLPEPCLESIFQYLKNDDLMNMVRVNGKLEFAPLPENC